MFSYQPNCKGYIFGNKCPKSEPYCRSNIDLFNNRLLALLADMADMLKFKKSEFYGTIDTQDSHFATCGAGDTFSLQTALAVKLKMRNKYWQ